MIWLRDSKLQKWDNGIFQDIIELRKKSWFFILRNDLLHLRHVFIVFDAYSYKTSSYICLSYCYHYIIVSYLTRVFFANFI